MKIFKIYKMDYSHKIDDNIIVYMCIHRQSMKYEFLKYHRYLYQNGTIPGSSAE